MVEKCREQETTGNRPLLRVRQPEFNGGMHLSKASCRRFPSEATEKRPLSMPIGGNERCKYDAGRAEVGWRESEVLLVHQHEEEQSSFENPLLVRLSLRSAVRRLPVCPWRRHTFYQERTKSMPGPSCRRKSRRS